MDIDACLMDFFVVILVCIIVMSLIIFLAKRFASAIVKTT